jgi:uncharacterized membrane protein
MAEHHCDRENTSMTQILFAAILFLATHLGISSTSLRGVLVSRIGERGYLGLYSVLALTTLSYLIWLYTELPRYDYFWLPDPDAYLLPKLVMPLALILLVGGFMVKNPTNVGAEGLLRDAAPDAQLAAGVTRITRHPFQWGVVLWAGSHLVANGDTISIVFFTTFGLLSGIGTVLLDAKKARVLGPDWEPYRQQTSNLPFLAIVQGRNRLVVGELWLPVVVGLLVYGLAFWGHQWLSGVRIV